MKQLAFLVLAFVPIALFCACGPATDGAPAAKSAVDSSRVEAAPAQGRERWESLSQAGLYRIAIRPETGEPRLGPLHTWLVQVESAAGKPVQATQLSFDGGMPQHSHGFETSPRVTDSLGEGLFRVDGVRFHMAGLWKIRVDVAGPDGADLAVFDVEVGP